MIHLILALLVALSLSAPPSRTDMLSDYGETRTVEILNYVRAEAGIATLDTDPRLNAATDRFAAQWLRSEKECVGRPDDLGQEWRLRTAQVGYVLDGYAVIVLCDWREPAEALRGIIATGGAVLLLERRAEDVSVAYRYSPLHKTSVIVILLAAESMGVVCRGCSNT